MKPENAENPLIPAATVLVVGDAAEGLEVLMLRKNSGQVFGGMWVFPGGRVEEGDGSGDDATRNAAVREAEEETGMALVPADLVPFAHWVPPPEAPKRFDTWFFLVAVPAGAGEIVVDGGEIGDHVWTTPATALARHAAGEIDLAPPTWVTLHRLAESTDVSSAVAAARAGDVEHFATRIGGIDDDLVAVWDPDAGYETGDLSLPGPRHRLVMATGGWKYERT